MNASAETWLVGLLTVLSIILAVLEWTSPRTVWKGDDKLAKLLRPVVRALRFLVSFAGKRRSAIWRPGDPGGDMSEGKMTLVGMPMHTLNIVNAISKKTGKGAADIISEAIDAKAKAVLGPDYLEKVPAN